MNGDGDVESDETFSLNLSSPKGATIDDGQGSGTITNDDQYRLSIDSVSHAEGNAGVTPFVFTVTLNGVSSSTVPVHYATADGVGSATVGDDTRPCPTPC